MSVVLDAIAYGKRELASHERQMAEALIRQYEIAWKRIERELVRLDAQILEAMAERGIVEESWLSRQRWWRETQASIDVEMARWEAEAARIVANAQAGGVSIATDVAGTIARAAGSPFAGRVYSQAFERWVSAIQPGSPILDVIGTYGPRVSESALRHMTEGMGSGRAPRNTVRAIMREVGDEAVEHRLMAMARTETMRSFRGASSDIYGPMRQKNIITGYRWSASLSSNTCIACLAMDSTVSKDFPETFHVNCRCTAIPVISSEYIPNQPAPRRSGEEWFAEQPEDVQRKMLLTPGRYKAYQDGTPLSAMVKTRHSDVWGSSISIRPMYDMQGATP